MPASYSAFALAPAVLLLGLLWYRLIAHLRIEWTVNPQYTYGWAVPVLCAYLLYRSVARANQRPECSVVCGSGSKAAGRLSQNPFRYGSLVTILFLAAVLLYFPVRLVQEANPEWRLVSWALALEVIAITVFLLRRLPAFQRLGVPLFPVLFFLVAVPWPTLLEAPLIQGLTRANTAVTVELLGAVGVPALRHGNTIEIGTGIVGIDDACSGIRSFQAALMLGLLFGELYQLTGSRRLAVCVSGLVCSFLFNVVRTVVLTGIAARNGSAAMSAWHDPAGVAILLGCFGVVWLLARQLRSVEPPPRITNCSDRPAAPLSVGSSVGSASMFGSPALTWGLAISVLLAEIGTEAWYRWHERQLPAPVTWTIRLPLGNATLRQVTLSAQARQFLRYDQAIDAGWQDTDARRWQAIFLQWQPGRTAAYLARGHTPEVCLTAAGNELAADARLCTVNCGGLRLPCRFYIFNTPTGPLHVLYSLWRDRGPNREFGAQSLTYSSRLDAVLTGTRLTGQRSLELALWGGVDDAEAQAALESQLRQLLVRKASVKQGRGRPPLEIAKPGTGTGTFPPRHP